MSGWDADEQQWSPAPARPGHGSVARRRRLVFGAVLALVLVGGLAALSWLFAGDGEEQGSVTPAPTAVVSSFGEPSGGSPVPETSGGPAPETSSGSVPTESAVPSGYRRVVDPAGFRVDVPEGWARSEKSDGVFYTSSDGASLLQLFTLEDAGTSPYESLSVAEKQVSKNPGYRLIGLERIGGGDVALLEYAYDNEEFGQRRVMDVAFTAPDGVQYAVLTAGPVGDWPQLRRHEDAALSSFCPLGHCPP